MPTFNKQLLEREAVKYGFRRDTFEKVVRLFPVIEIKANFDLEGMKAKVKKYITDLMVLMPNEKEYLERFEKKEYIPELLFDDKAILNRVKDHPMALWKCR